MRKKNIGFALSAMLLALSVPVEAQQQSKVAKIGWLGIGSASSVSRYEEFRRVLRELGYFEGKNINFEYRSADNRLDRLPSLADELVLLQVDLIITRGTPEALALKKATRTIPIVFYDVTDPVGAGLVDSLARPGGNITGFSGIEAVLAGKRLELLKEIIPKLSRVAVLWNPQDLSSAQQWKASQLPAQELGLQLYSMEVSSADKYEGAFRAAAKARSDALAVIAGSLEDSSRTRLADLSTKNRLPAIYPRPVFVESGGLMSYGRDRDEALKRVPSMIDKILKGTKPADIPVEQPTKFELVINLKTAKVLGLTIAPVVLMRAQRVIKEASAKAGGR
jgi:putative ABC transport system substrate-binding protein